MDDRSLYTSNSARPPATPTEACLVESWQEVLAVFPVGCEDNFLELGGTSMLAARVAARIGARLGIQLPVELFLETESLAEAAEKIHALSPGQAQ